MQQVASLESKIINYQAPEGAKQLVEETRPVFLVGVTGAGKDTLKKSLFTTDKFHEVISHTTRLPRVNSGVLEISGTDYHFIDLGEAERLVDHQAFIEVKYVHGTVYGTSVDEFEAARRDGKVAITDIDVQGVDEYHRLSEQVIAVFVLPPSIDEWQHRLLRRYGSQAKLDLEWPVRRASALKEIKHALDCGYYQFLANDTLETAQQGVIELVRARREDREVDDQAARQLAKNLLAELAE